MTRFARAAGSKSSNERTPADATPWAVMKEQLARSKLDAEAAKKSDEAEKKRIENYVNFRNEQKTMKHKMEAWCEFPETTREQKHDNKEPKKKKKKHNEEETNVNDYNIPLIEAAVLVAPKEKNKKKNKHNPDETKANDHNIPHDEAVAVITPTEKKKNKHNIEDTKVIDHNIPINEAAAVVAPKEKNKKNTKSKLHNKDVNEKTESMSQNELSFFEKDSDMQSKKAYKNIKTKNADKASSINTSNVEHGLVTEKVNNKAKKKIKRRNKNTDNAITEGCTENAIFPQADTIESRQPKYPLPKQQKQKKTKFENGHPVRRKVEDDQSFQLIINGREVELVRYHGFPVMKRDAERLDELQKSMNSKGIPKREVERTMKLERRRAEKALARLKRDVCYNCRKGGHNLSDCPELKSKMPVQGGGADGVCFKCGSTEHRQIECKVQRNQEFRFASCFICKEQGHIARQCPDNAKGLYPNGGACKLCGDVTHLRKDCPTSKSEREETSVRLETLAGAEAIEDIAPSVHPAPAPSAPNKPKKVKF